MNLEFTIKCRIFLFYKINLLLFRKLCHSPRNESEKEGIYKELQLSSCWYCYLLCNSLADGTCICRELYCTPSVGSGICRELYSTPTAGLSAGSCSPSLGSQWAASLTVSITGIMTWRLVKLGLM